MIRATVGLTAALLLTVSFSGGSPTQAAGCKTKIDSKHVLRASGTTSVVKTRKSKRKELVLRGVTPSALRDSLDGESSTCSVDLNRFERHWKKLRYDLHAQLRSPSGKWAIKVSSIDYDPVKHTLRARGRLVGKRAVPRQIDPSTEIVYASTFVPFDSSF